MNKYTTIEEFLADLSDDRRQQVEAIREIVTQANSSLTEHIKWNSPSYILDGEDRITFNMHYPDQTMLVLHMGATRKEDKKADPIMKDETGLIKWSSDSRGYLSFKSINEIEDRKSQLTKTLTDWLTIK